MERKRWYWVVTTLVVFFCAAAPNWAGPTTDSWIARFGAPEQSMWSQGGSASAPAISPYTVETNPKSVFYGSRAGFVLGASSGVVRGNVEGAINASYRDYLNNPGTAYVSLSYTGIEDESQIQTSFGAQIGAFAEAKINAPLWPTGFNPAVGAQAKPFQLDIKEDFTTGLGSPAFASAENRLFSLGADILLVGVDTGIDLYQDVSFMATGIKGLVKYTHLDTGEEPKPVEFTLNSDGDPFHANLDLDKPGYWEVNVSDLELGNTFSTEIGGKVSLTAWTALLGDVFSAQLGVGLYDTPQFGLQFDKIDTLGRFYIHVGDGYGAPAIPVPGAVWLVGSGLSVLVIGRRRCHHLMDGA